MGLPSDHLRSKGANEFSLETLDNRRDQQKRKVNIQEALERVAPSCILLLFIGFLAAHVVRCCQGLKRHIRLWERW